ncbi:UNVERIFIED_CONTAM: hypothetical protein PYX00_008356 [Menopon gallinae]|uniref:Uncharacterized protein n=1 Tax=Menopon gallinae TaxID=328185 RepID=A0AAW2HN22_9NEOP
MIAFGGGTAWTISQSYDRYLANPTVITLDKSYRSWNITFPATTFCFVNRLDTEKAARLIKRKWGVDKGKKFDYYMKFLGVLSNSSYNNLASFEEFKNDRQLYKENLLSLMNEVCLEDVIFLLESKFVSFNKKNLHINEIL